MKTYVIGKYEEKTYVSALMRQLEEDGHEITHDWTTDESIKDVSGTERLTRLRVSAEADLNGALTAEAVVVCHHDQLCGGLVEFGAALADPRKLICILGDPNPAARRQPIFYWLPRVRFFETSRSLREFMRNTEKRHWE